MLEQYGLVLALICALIAIGYGLVSAGWINRQPAGNERMQKIAGAIANVDGVEKTSVKVLFNASKAKVNFDPEKTNLDTITQAVKNIGYDVLKASAK